MQDRQPHSDTNDGHSDGDNLADSVQRRSPPVDDEKDADLTRNTPDSPTTTSTNQ